jgi:hypothetical protein
MEILNNILKDHFSFESKKLEVKRTYKQTLPTEYRGYKILHSLTSDITNPHTGKTNTVYCGHFCSSAGGVTPFFVGTLVQLTRMIDEDILSNRSWPVDMGNGHVEEFVYLNTALNYLHGHGSIVGAQALFTFDSF